MSSCNYCKAQLTLPFSGKGIKLQFKIFPGCVGKIKKYINSESHVMVQRNRL